MSYVNLQSISWGSAPVIGVAFAYDYQRSGANMLYRVRVTVSPVGGGSYFGYPIYVDLSLEGSKLVSGAVVKAASPNTWSSSIVYESGWMSVCKTSGTTALTIRLYSGSGSARSNDYSYSLPVSSYYSGGGTGSTVTMADFTLSFGALTIGQSNVLTFSRPSGSYTATVSYRFGNAAGAATLTTTATAATRVVYDWTMPDALASEIAAATSGTGTLTLSVYRSGSYFGQKTYDFTAYAAETLRPTATLTTAVVNDNAVLAGWGICVKGLSRLSYCVSAQGQGGAAVSGYAFRFAGQELSDAVGTTEPVSASGTLTPSATVTDTRGRTITVTAEPITVYDYHIPALRSAFAWRCDAQGNEQEDGAYLKVQCAAECSPLHGRNAVTLRARYRPMGGSYGGYTTLSDGVVTTLAGGLDARTAYEVELSAADTVGNAKTVVCTSGTRQVTLHLKEGGTGAAFGKYAQSDALECAWDAAFDGDVEVAGDLSVTGQLHCEGVSFDGGALVDLLYPVGAIYLSAVSTHPATLFGGTWTAIEDRFLLCAGSSFAADSVGGSAAHSLTEAELPAHSHSFSGTTDEEDLSHSHSVGADYDGAPGSGNYTVHSAGYPGNSKNPDTSEVSLNHSHSFSGTTGAAGSGTAFSLLPPYLTVYAWKRIA